MLSTRGGWAGLGICFLLILIWTVRLPLIDRQVDPRTLLTAKVGLSGALLLFGGAIWLWTHYQTRRGAALIEESLRGQADEAAGEVRPEKREEIRRIEEEFGREVARLQESRIGKERGRKSALYALPWYLVIGPPGVGKTTAIRNSGLRFPVERRAVDGFGGTRNCKWYITASAILIDTAGRYMTVEDDRPEWLAFLEILKRYRPKAPINGVILTQSLEEISGSTARGTATARELRRRIDELTDRLGVRVPVHVVFTKCDLLHGFVPSFASLSEDAVGQVWGCSFSDEQCAVPLDYFDGEYSTLVEQLSTRRDHRILTDSDHASGLLLLPLELEARRSGIRRFLTTLFEDDGLTETPELRGFYFTSAVQEAQPSSIRLSDVSTRFGLSEWYPTHESSSDRAYFLDAVWDEVIVPDKDRVRLTTASRSRLGWLRRSLTLLAAASVLLFAITAARSFSNARSELTHLRAAANAVQTLPSNGRLSALDFVLLDSLWTVMAAQESRGPIKEASLLGLDRSESVRAEARRIYVSRMRPWVRERVLTPSTTALAGDAGATSSGAPSPSGVHGEPAPPNGASQALGQSGSWQAREPYDHLKAYLLLTDSVSRLANGRHQSDRQWLVDYGVSAALANPAAEPIDSMALATQLGYVIGTLESPLMRSDRQLLRDVRARINRPLTEFALYERIRTGGSGTPSLRIEQMIQEGSETFVTGSTAVPRVFTQRGWREYVDSALVVESTEPGRGDWVMGTAKNELPPALRDSDRLSQALFSRYLREYAQAWHSFAVGVRFEGGDPGHVDELLGILGDPESSPLVQILRRIARETRFSREGFVETASEFLRDRPWFRRLLSEEGRPVDARGPLGSQFAALHALRESDEALGLILSQYHLVRAALSEGSAPGLVIEQARSTILETASGLDPEVIGALFLAPLEIAARQVQRQSIERVEGAWRSQVCSVYDEQLANTFPFTWGPGGDANEARIQDVRNFFHPTDGLLWTFFDEHLSGFIDRGSLTALPGQVVSAVALAELRAARTISQGLFAQGELGSAFTLTPEHFGVENDPDRLVTRACVQVGDQEAGDYGCYLGGAKRTYRFQWQGADERVVISGKTDLYEWPGAGQGTFNGPWAWLKALDAATVTRTTGGSTEYLVTWPLNLRWGEPQSFPTPQQLVLRYKMQTDRSAHPFENARQFFAFQCPQDLN